MEIFLNRWRGTGIIFSRITGTMIYASYIGLLFGLISTWYVGLSSTGLIKRTGANTLAKALS